MKDFYRNRNIERSFEKFEDIIQDPWSAFRIATEILRNLRERMPKDIIFASPVSYGEVEYFSYGGPHGYPETEETKATVLACLSEGGLLAHGFLISRELAKSLQGVGLFPSDFVSLSNVDIDQLKSGDQVTIDLTNSESVILTVKRIITEVDE